MKVIFLHLDLGIGGAEQLVVTVAKAIQDDLHGDVLLLTTHHNPSHCFEETKPNGCLGSKVLVFGDWLPRHLFWGRFTALFAIIRMIYLSIALYFFVLPRVNKDVATVVFLDGVSAPIPLLRMLGFKVIFYCHFPDLLLCTERSSPVKRFYRKAIDCIEEFTTGFANLTLVNSKYTQDVFRATFKSLGEQRPPFVLYPAVPDILSSVDMNEVPLLVPYTQGYDFVFLSLNRYERKKNIFLAIDSFIIVSQKVPQVRLLLVIAGGYDTSVRENVEYLKELKAHCAEKGLAFGDGSHNSSSLPVSVIFRTSIPMKERNALLVSATCLLYTPDKEHFGIVPIEAMQLGTPVIAVNSGGPKETVLHGSTGFLCEQSADSFAKSMITLVEQPDELPRMKNLSKKHVAEYFESNIMVSNLQKFLNIATE
eukprot:gene29519-38627_t